jgi:streptogramin lyase
MAIKQVGIFKLAELAATPAAGINITRAKLDARQLVGTLQLSDKGVGTNVNLGMCTDNSGNIYISDPSTHVILKMTEGGKINHLAGSAGVSGNNSALQNVKASDARFYTPRGLACDKSGNIYVADTGNNQIRIIRDGKVGVLAGNGARTAGLVDASSNPLQAKFSSPIDVAVDNSGNVFVSDAGNLAIRKIYGGKVLNICGGATGNLQNVKASNVAGANGFFAANGAMAVDANGNLFVSDATNKNIKKITPNGWVYLFSGAGTAGHALGTGATPAYTCTYDSITSMECDRNGNIYITDEMADYMRIIKINQFGVPSNVIEFSEAGAGTNNAYLGMAVSPAGKLFVAMLQS